MGWGQLGQVRLGGGGLDKSTTSCKLVECGEGMELCSGIGLVGISATDWFGGVGWGRWYWSFWSGTKRFLWRNGTQGWTV